MFEENESVEMQEVAEPVQENTEVGTVVDELEEVVEPQQDKQPQSQEENSKFASMRRQMEQEFNSKQQQAVDAEYSRLYGDSHGIHTKADYDNAVRQAERDEQIQLEAQQQGTSEELIRRMKDLEDMANTTKAEKAEYQRQLSLIKEHETLSKDETFKDYYAEHQEDIKASADKYGVDYTTAMLLSIKDNFKAIKEGTAAKAQQETINNIIKNGKSSPGSLAQGGENKTQSVWDMSAEEFKKYKESKFNN